eukprot:scaffold9960_cov71-Phaeocystis_antarctica.AAC.6
MQPTSLLPGQSALTPPRPRLPHASASNTSPAPRPLTARSAGRGTAARAVGGARGAASPAPCRQATRHRVAVCVLALSVQLSRLFLQERSNVRMNEFVRYGGYGCSYGGCSYGGCSYHWWSSGLTEVGDFIVKARV